MQSKKPPAAGRVLIVEDEAAISLMLEGLLNQLGYDVVGPASDLGSALALADATKIDCGLLDVRLGADTVYELAELLKSRRIPFVFATGYEHIETRFSDVPVVRKPFTERDIEGAILKALSGARI